MKIFHTMNGLDLAQLNAVYTQSNRASGKQEYPNLSENMQILQAEQDFFAYLKLFFTQSDSVYAVWAPDGVYTAALRVEPYADGVLLAGLETLPDFRCKGNATMLVQGMLRHLSEQGSMKVYSHVDKRNTASLRVHERCGFERILEYAVYADGSVLRSSCTFCYTV